MFTPSGTSGIYISAGAPFNITIFNDVWGNPLPNFSGYFVSGTLKQYFTSGDLTNFVSSFSGSGINLSLTDIVTASLPVDQNIYCVRLYPSGYPSGVLPVINVLKGYANIYPNFI